MVCRKVAVLLIENCISESATRVGVLPKYYGGANITIQTLEYRFVYQTLKQISLIIILCNEF